MMRKKREKRRLVKILMIVLIILIVLTCFLLAIRFDFFGNILDSTKKPMKIEIPGECYLIMGNIFYNINNEDDCKKECDNECWVRKKEYVNSEFIEDQQNCNLCNCYCK